MTDWGSALWEPSTAESTWEDVDSSVGWPVVELKGVDVTDYVVDVAWSRGREWWLAAASPGVANIQLSGTLAESPVPTLLVGDTVAIRAYPLGYLWTGWVDGITETTDPEDGELAYAVSIASSDALSRLLTAQLYKSLVLAAGTLDVRLLAIAQAAGVPNLPVIVLPTSGTLPTLAAVTLTGSSGSPVNLADHLDQCEKASNAIVAVSRDGSWIVQPRARLVATPPVIDVDPDHLDRALATPERVRNVFTIAGVETVNSPSVLKYGRKAYDVPAGVATTAPPYAPETLAAFAEPAPFAVASVPVRSRNEAPVLLSPFDYVRVATRPTSELYQALAMSWRAGPDEWQVGLNLDRTQASIAPPTGTDPPDPIPPGTTTTTVTFTCDRSAYVVRTSGGSNAGNGASVDLLVGLLADGNLARALLRFPVTFLGHNVRVGSARLRLHVGASTCMSAGSSPSLGVWRNASSWSAGTFATRCAFSSSNAVVYPGPAVTGAKVTRAASGTEGALVEVSVTAHVQALADGAANYGFQIRGASESTSSNRVPLYSRTAAASGDRPTLVVTYTYDH